MDWIWRLIRGIWGLARIALVAVAYSIGATGLYGLLFMGFFAVGLVLVLFGFNLDAVDNWLDARADWFDWAGTILFKALLAIILLGCVVVLGKGIADRLPLPGRLRRHKKHRAARAGGKHRTARATGAPRLSESSEPLPGAAGGGERMAGHRQESGVGDKPMGCGAVIAAIVVGYFCYVGLVN